MRDVSAARDRAGERSDRVAVLLARLDRGRANPLGRYTVTGSVGGRARKGPALFGVWAG